jgi:Domain of unknown function (DUF1707)
MTTGPRSRYPDGALLGGAVATGPWDPTRASTPGRDRFLASNADRERVIDILKTAFVHGALTKDELAVRTGRTLNARTYGQLAAITADLARGPAGASRPATVTVASVPARKRLNKKVVAWSACALVLAPALSAAFFTFYGGFLVMFAFTFLGTVITSTSPGPRRPGPAPLNGRQ